MLRLPIAMLVPLAAAAPAAGQSKLALDDTSSSPWVIPLENEPPVARRGVSLPVIDYVAPDGSLKIKRGIVAGVAVGPNATIGVGLYETVPSKPRVAPSDSASEREPRRSRQAAVGFSLRF